jgi:hypothetical protein
MMVAETHTPTASPSPEFCRAADDDETEVESEHELSDDMYNKAKKKETQEIREEEYEEGKQEEQEEYEEEKIEEDEEKEDEEKYDEEDDNKEKEKDECYYEECNKKEDEYEEEEDAANDADNVNDEYNSDDATTLSWGPSNEKRVASPTRNDDNDYEPHDDDVNDICDHRNKMRRLQHIPDDRKLSVD